MRVFFFFLPRGTLRTAVARVRFDRRMKTEYTGGMSNLHICCFSPPAPPVRIKITATETHTSFPFSDCPILSVRRDGPGPSPCTVRKCAYVCVADGKTEKQKNKRLWGFIVGASIFQIIR